MLFKCGEYPQRRQHEEVRSIGISGSGGGDICRPGVRGVPMRKTVRALRGKEAVPDVRTAVQHHSGCGERDREDRGSVSAMPEALQQVQ